MESAVQGVGATQGSITDTGALGAYDNMLIYANSEYRIIDSDVPNTATIVGVWSALPSGNYTVYNWGTKVTGTNSLGADMSIGSVHIENIDFDGTSRDILLLNRSSVQFRQCRFAGYVGQELNSGGTYSYSLFNNADSGILVTSGSTGEFLNCKIRATGAWAYPLRSYLNGVIYYDGGTVIDCASLAGSFGMWIYKGSAAFFDQPQNGYARIRNCAVVGIYAQEHGDVTNTANNQYTNNLANETAHAASFGYID
jgi:hypothetical protein